MGIIGGRERRMKKKRASVSKTQSPPRAGISLLKTPTLSK
jgi:hypothetical protein